MGQVLHGSAKTTHAIRGELQRPRTQATSPEPFGMTRVDKRH